MLKSQAETRQTGLQKYIMTLHRLAENMPHQIDVIQAKRAIKYIKDELGTEYAIGINPKCPRGRKKIKKVLKSLRLLKNILEKAESMDVPQTPGQRKKREDIGKERPGHLYVKRERDVKTGKWKYTYRNTQTGELSTYDELQHKEFTDPKVVNEFDNVDDFLNTNGFPLKLKRKVRDNNKLSKENNFKYILKDGKFTYKGGLGERTLDLEMGFVIERAREKMNDWFWNLKVGDNILIDHYGTEKEKFKIKKINKDRKGLTSTIKAVNDKDYEATIDKRMFGDLYVNDNLKLGVVTSDLHFWTLMDADKKDDYFYNDYRKHEKALLDYIGAGKEETKPAAEPKKPEGSKREVFKLKEGEKVSRQEVDKYTGTFVKGKNLFESRFDKWVSPKTEAEGDKLLKSKTKLVGGKLVKEEAIATGYNITRYEVHSAGFHKQWFGDKKNMHLSVSMYNSHPTYSQWLLIAVRKQVGDVPYAVTQRGSKFAWDEEWSYDKTNQYEDAKGNQYLGKYDEKKGQRYAKAMEHNVVFQPKDQEQYDKLAEVIKKFQDKKSFPEGSFVREYGWYTPDNRSNVETKDPDFKEAFLNVKPIGKQELTIITKGNPMPKEHGADKGFNVHKIFINKELFEIVNEMKKSMQFVINLLQKSRK